MMAIESDMNQGVCGDEEYPLVSIAIITYNQKEYLRECIESCLIQDYPNFEIVVADDCSTDGTQDLLRMYDTNYPGRFVLRLAEKNQGITPNSNVCISACSGKYIAILGGDDLLLESKITKQVKVLEADSDINLCGTFTKLVDSKGRDIGIRKDFKRKKTPIYTVCELIESGNGLVPVVSYMFRASSLPEEGFEPRIPIASDSLFMCRVVGNKKIVILKEALTAYRVHDSHAKKIGYKLDSLISRAFIEFYFPHCIPKIIERKAISYLSQSVHAFLIDDKELGFCMLKNSMSFKVNLKSIIVFILAKLGLIKTAYGLCKKVK